MAQPAFRRHSLEGYKQVRDETISFFIAGHATIASALTWTWYLLSTHPEAWRRLRDEVGEVLEPEWLAPEAARARHRMAFFPFSGGPRRCIGEGFAQLQLPWWWPWWPSATGSASSRPARPRSRRPSPSVPAPRC
jgi:cytochrome P450